MSNSGPPEPEKKLAYALDPIHIGAGGYQLGRVDNSIVRDPATQIPKIPGTSIAGAIRAYATYYLMENDKGCKAKSNHEEKRQCAEKKSVKYFGDDKNAGILRFYDGQIVFFPVNSIYGTVWITTKELLKYWCKNREAGEEVKVPEVNDDTVQILQKLGGKSTINLGWLMLKAEKSDGESKVKIPSKLKGKNVVLVSEKLFSHIVNDNLEVRTSVSIDSKTGAAKDGALFTYEAIPRGTIIGFEITQDFRKDSKDLNISDILRKTYPYLKVLGIGGMGTRGFGRLEILDGG